MPALDMDVFKEVNKQWRAGLMEAGERVKFRDAAVASLKRQLAEEKKVEEARKRPLSREAGNFQTRTRTGGCAPQECRA